MKYAKKLKGISRIDLHGHLASPVYDGSPLPVITRIACRLGKRGVLGVASIFNQGPRGSDRRYETLVDKEFSPYGKQDLDGRATYIPETQAYIINATEIQTREGDFLVIGHERDTMMEVTPDTSFADVAIFAEKQGAILGATHPFYHNGAGPFLQQQPEALKHIHFIEVTNGEAHLLLLHRNWGANRKAKELSQEARARGHNRTLGVLVSSDNHALFELGKHHTLVQEIDAETGEQLMNQLKYRIAHCHPAEEILEQHQTAPWTGRLGALHHICWMLYTKAIRPTLGLKDI